MAQRRSLFGVRQQTVQPARTTPEQDETGADGGGSSILPIERQLVAQHRMTLPQKPMDDDETLVEMFKKLFQDGSSPPGRSVF